VSIDARWIWRIVACLGVWGCASLARVSIDGYLRHRATGDQAGFALSMAFLVFGFVPATSISLVLGMAPGPPAAGRIGAGGWLARLAVSGALLTGAAFFLWFQAHVHAMVAQDGAAGGGERAAWSFESAAAWVLIAFALFQAGCATVILWPSAARSWWFSVLLVAVGLTAVAAAAIVTGLSGPGALVVAVPWVAWIAVAAWVWRAGRQAHAITSR
jgi:hypothetical protein